MFEAHPDMKNHFEKFKNADNERLFKSTALQDHASAVMEMIDTFVTELDDADKTHAKIKKIGGDHKKRKIPDEHLKVSDAFFYSRPFSCTHFIAKTHLYLPFLRINRTNKTQNLYLQLYD